MMILVAEKLLTTELQQLDMVQLKTVLITSKLEIAG